MSNEQNEHNEYEEQKGHNEYEEQKGQSEKNKPWIISKVQNTGKSFGREFKHSSRVQEGSPADYVQKGWSRVMSTKMGEKIKAQLDKNKK